MARWLAGLVLLGACSGSSSGETLELSPAGGEVRTGDGALRLIPPPGAVDMTLKVTVARVPSPQSGSIGPVFELGPSGTTFAAPVTVVLRVDDADRAGRLFETLRVATVDGTGHWTTLASPKFSQGQGTVSGDTTHLSPFGVVAVPEGQDGGVPDARPPVDAGVVDAPIVFDARRDSGPGDACVQSACTPVPTPGTPCADCGREFIACIDASPTTCFEYYCAGGYWQRISCRDGG